MQFVRGLERWTVQPRCPRHVQVRFVDRSHLHLRREVHQHLVNFLRALAVALRVSIHKNGVRTKLGRGSQRQRRMYSKPSRLVRSRRHYPALVTLSSDNDSLAFQRRIVQLLHRDEECIHIDVEDGSGESRQLGCDGHERIVAAKGKAPHSRKLSAALTITKNAVKPAPSPAPEAYLAPASPARRSCRTHGRKRSRKSLCSCHSA